ncbi:uncharacterized protein LOC123988184 isoform X1 [Osmia bicornis bicornis]|uniref:uncharacterized protein LOC123988184 isoform X1 n=1 Tax=Osmia bicornis bicornis TaxID=1437191 RepID=UPI001EAEEB49|nr:uncharacterized protein LOC123988184 isoform X1 [Osmia bicornis bicornis]XP_046143256.1 uncharacterized protein LOC123988184 isoform X1 [Osmia bicornis bicornis]XP_046143257.1 uncharacterized protein LOC123988184 isoform X1 [Osmia bicornis bicornis]
MMMSALGVKNVLNIYILIIVCCFDLSNSRPTEQPTKISLNTGDGLKTIDSQLASTLERVQEFLGHFVDAIRIATGRFVNSITLARNIIADRAEAITSESQNKVEKTEPSKPQQRSIELVNQPPVINTRPDARETVRLENESAQSFFERPLSKPAAGILESFLQPTPIVDGLKEQEKYGNTGDKFIGIGRALVSSFEGFSNFLNAVVDFPRNAAKKTSRGLTEALNHVGAKLVGLE